MDAVPPVVRGEFLYRDVLLVDVGGDLKRHPRASEVELKRLLNGKDQKDQVGHWWEAQLIHYGLNRTKDKNACKVRLSQALAQGKLKTQPPHLPDLEQQMKKDYQAAYRKAMKGSATPSKGTKRGREEDEAQSTSKSTKISVKAGNVSIDIDQSGGTSAKKRKTEKVAESSSKSTVAKSAAPKKAQSAPSAARQTKPKKAQDEDPPARPSKTLITPKSTKKVTETPAAAFSSDNVFQASASSAKPSSSVKREPDATRVKKEPNVKKEPTVKASPLVKKETIIKREVGVKKESVAKKQPGVKKESRVKGETSTIAPSPGYLFDADAMDTRADITERQISVTGVYTLSCPQLSEQLPEFRDKLRLFISVDNEHGLIWGGFELAMKSGVLKMTDIGIGRPLSFGWRARDSWDNQLRFGKNCFGEMEFDGEGGVRGWIHSMFPGERVEFEGRRRPGPLWAGKSNWRFEQEWDEFPREAYGR